MNARFSELAEQTPARGASVHPGQPAMAGGPHDWPAAEEAALMGVLRILNRVKVPRPLTPVERSFVVGAKALFEELTEVCDQLLAAQRAEEPPAPPAQPAPAPEEAAPASPARTGRRAAAGRPTPGGATH